MSRDKVIKGVIAGAVVGGLLTLTNKDTRNYVTKGVKNCGSQVSFYLHNPVEAVQQLNNQYTQYSKQLSATLTSVLDILNQVQSASNKLLERDEHESS
ncbi:MULTISPECIES: YtxH domain-containing protein [Gracilibacillus]|uniref:YtxH domain-containing protein n=1 Tax=Gracilibacillus TaxID=74385 RepID=UPI000824B5C8|nr:MULTISPECIES: YtxH domain-containing protein [Gracilibacillus]